MLDKMAFMETLHSVQEVARTSLTPLTKEEIQTYFKDMELTKEQEEMVYRYLLQPQEEDNAEPETEAEEQTDGNESRKQQASAHFQMYLDEIGVLPDLDEAQEKNLYERLAKGDMQAVSELSAGWLQRVVDIASEYDADGLLLDDMVQEGNMGLLMGLNSLLGKKEPDCRTILEQYVREAVENYLEEEAGEGEQENSVLAKVSLVHEAGRSLEKELGSTPSIRQLAEYTRISEEEISDILSLAKEVKKDQ